MGIEQIKPDLWLLDVRVYRNGRQYRARERFRGYSGKAAERRFHELHKELLERAESGNGSFSYSHAQHFSECLDYYTERHDVGRSKPYYARLRADLGTVQIVELAQRFDAWLLLMKRSKGQRTGRPLANGTLNQYLARASAALGFCVRHGLLEQNPLRHFKKLKEVPKDVSLSDEQRARLLNTIAQEAPHLLAIVRYALQVPCRKSELIGLTRGDLDLFNNCIRVRCGRTKNDAGIDKPIPPDMLDYFRNLPPESQYLFYRECNGRFLPLGDFKRAFNRCLRLAGLAGAMTFHSTRHLSATALVDNGTPEQVVMTVAGWRSPMLRVYYNRSPKRALELVRFSPSPAPVLKCVARSVQNT